jgi:two-component sensor histidine kinase
MSALVWRERGGPPVTTPSRSGFGSRLFALALRGQGGSVSHQFAPEGFEARIAFPVLQA